jgi:hypothetical protein
MMRSLLERINAAHKGVRGKAAAGHFSFSYFSYPDVKSDVTRAETGTNAGELSDSRQASHSSYQYNYAPITCRMDDPARF